MQTVMSYDVEERDFMDVNQDGKAEFLHTTFVFGEAGKDGKLHNYWVYNLLKFSGTNLVSANALDARLPRWIWYTYKPNHKDTDQLTAAQRERLWLKTWRHEASLFGLPMFPHPEWLADEQGQSLLRNTIKPK